MGSNKGWDRITNPQISIEPISTSPIIIVLDSNFLMALSQIHSLNLPSELDRVVPGKRKLIVLNSIKEELSKLSQEGNSRTRTQARFALEFIKRHCEDQEAEYFHKNIDFILLDYAEKHKGIIATNDKKLRKLAIKKAIKTLYIRNRQFLELK